jgi:dUTPase
MAAESSTCHNCPQTHYTLELFPTSEESRKLYEKLLSGVAHERSDTTFGLNPDNAGVDLCAASSGEVLAESVVLMDLGVKARMTKHWYSCKYGSPVMCSAPCHYWLAPRSSIWKSGFRMANSMGVIDLSYRGILMAPVIGNVSGAMAPFQQGARYFQILAPDMGHIHEVNLMPLTEIDTSTRGEGGFGSTGH